MQDNQVPWRLKLAASALVSPLILAPAVTITAMFWARSESIRLHPEAAALNPPTVSRAIADPQIGDIFALWIFAVAALQAFAVLRIAQATYRTSLVPFPARYGGVMAGLLAAGILSQASAIAGVIMLSQYTGYYSDDLHTLGSYMMFVGNGVSIVLYGAFVSLDRAALAGGPAPATGPPRPYEFYIHTRFAWLVSVVGIVFFALYTWFDFFAAYHDYGFRVAFVVCELVLVVGSLVYLGCFIVSMYRYELYSAMQRAPARAAGGAQPPAHAEELS